MHNKLIILSLLFASAFSLWGQQGTPIIQSQELSVSVYPNPAVDYIIMESSGEASNISLELISMIGNKFQVKSEKISTGKYKVSLKDLTSGYYFLVVVRRNEKNIKIKKAFKFLKR